LAGNKNGVSQSKLFAPRIEDPMRNLPFAARWYLITLWIVAAILVAATLFYYTLPVDQILLLLLWLPLFVLADYFEVSFEVGDGNRASMTVTDAAMIFLVAIAGPSGVLATALGTYIVGVLHRHDWYRNLFNVAQRSITYLVMLLLYRWLTGPEVIPFAGLRGLAALGAVAGIDYALNIIFVATVIAFATRQPLLRVYRDSFRQVSWIYLVTMPVGAILAVLWWIDPWLLIPGVVPLFMAQRSFKALAAWQAESRRNKTLAQESQQLAGRLERLQDATTAMLASLEPLPLLETVSARLAALMEAPARWVILLDHGRAHLAAAGGLPPGFDWDAPAYAAEIRQGLQLLDQDGMAQLHTANDPTWQALVIIPLALEERALGGICLALDRPLVLAEDDRRVLLSFAAQAALAMERARLFEELRLKQDELIRSSKLAALGTFSAGIAHEFNNLLAGILGYAQLGLGSAETDDKNEALEVAVRSCMRGRSITSGLLTFARRSEPQRGLHQITDAIEDTIVLVERELAKNNIRVERRFEPIPATICDPGQLAQVALNLMTNARDAMVDLGGGTITVWLAERNGQIELVIGDTGSGIPEHLLDEVFQPFMTTKGALGGSVTPGSGLGLAISYGIIESHNGTIAITSTVGVGTTVIVRIPIVNDVAAAAGKPIVAGAMAPLRILVVDDEPVVVESVARMLESQGHQVISATDGTTALRRFCEQSFDLVLSDIVMPGMSGAEFVERLRAIDPDVRVLIMTGHIAHEQVEQLLRDGALGVVRKPFVIDELLAAVAAARSAEMPALRAA
jgi:signal transduction histidine kinase/ActR/RegA family two-component response regulator